IPVASLRDLVKILTLYYDYIEFYMDPALFVITMDTMKSCHDEIAFQSIEFWSNVCNEEYELQLLQQENKIVNLNKQSRYYVRGTLPYLVPVLLQRLTTQEDSNDDDYD
ncbi:unnamed protein product, partial [Rotaria sp. Silwood2]